MHARTEQVHWDLLAMGTEYARPMPGRSARTPSRAARTSGEMGTSVSLPSCRYP